MSNTYSAIEAARIVAESGTAPKAWCDYVAKLALEARQFADLAEYYEKQAGYRCVYDAESGGHYRVPLQEDTCPG